jgi:hypothetical protein
MYFEHDGDWNVKLIYFYLPLYVADVKWWHTDWDIFLNRGLVWNLPIWAAVLLPVLIAKRWNGWGFGVSVFGIWLLVHLSNYLARESLYIWLWWFLLGLPVAFFWSGIVWSTETLIAYGWRQSASCSWRFSLRTLLIATTLFALVLGIIVWASR